MIVEELQKALNFFGLAPFVTYKEIKDRYKDLSRKFHPDFGGDQKKMEELNYFFSILKEYIENYRFTFSEEEILKQHIGSDYASRFRF